MGRTPFDELIEASRQGDLGGIEAALARGADVNGAESGVYNPQISCETGYNTALMYAAVRNHPAAVNLLLDRGARLEATDGEGLTPLHYAIAGNASAAMRTLVERGASLKAVCIGGSILGCAIRFMSTDDVDYLIARGAGVNDAIWDGSTPLMAAVENSKSEVVRLLLDRGADPAAVTSSGNSAFAIATRRRDCVVLQALHSGPAPRDADGALWRASILGDLAAVRTALARGASVDALTPGGKSAGDATALMYAAMCGHRAVAEALLDAGAHPDRDSLYHFNPLHCAIANDHLEIARLLLDRGASLRHKAYYDGTPLVHAASKGRVALAELLISRGADVNDRAHPDTTPLAAAVTYDHGDMVKLLLAHGADPSLKNGDGESPLRIAERRKMAALLELLRSGSRP